MTTQLLIFIGQQWILVSILLVLVFLYFRAESQLGGPVISVHQLSNLVNRDNAIVLDIRDHNDYREGHIVDALHIPFLKLKERLSELEKHKDKPIVIVDKMGQHSGAAGQQLGSAGFRISRLDGGMTEWRGNNLPVIKG